ncbi:MAG: translation initiation factor IF-2 [Cyanobacteria bacterium]|nr:translation initiation factor IF-2 [Cyanobacteriota bacterium]
MSTGRVRIYELSKELNLENRDILAICDRLDIVAKSHSSTIDEDDAVRIRSEAKNQPASRPPAPPVAPVRPSSPASPPSPGGDPQGSNAPQKILEIRSTQTRPVTKPVRPSMSDSPTPPQPPAPRPNAAKLVSPPARPAAPRTVPKPIAPSANSAPETAPEGGAIAPPPKPEPKADPKPEVKLVARPEPPKLVKPPARQTAPAPSASTVSAPTPRLAPPSKPSRPGPSRPGPTKAAGGEKGAPVTDAGRPKPTIVELRRPKPVKPAGAPVPAGGIEGDEEDSVKLLDKPTRPTKPSADAGTEAGDGTTDTYESRLKRPTPTRTPRKGTAKVWEDERPEVRPAKEKVKGKRRTQIDLDDDEEFDDSLDGANGPEREQVSLSIARPPKPKGAGSPKPQPAPTKAPTPKRRSRPSRDRREAARNLRPERPEILSLQDNMTVAELARTLVVPETEIIKRLFLKGMAVNINQTLDMATITMVAEEMGVLVETTVKESAARKVTEMLDLSDLESLQRRPPVVTIMGHVDHGKTTLLDSIRKTKVAQGEAGGITQHIGAYHVDVEHNGAPQKIVFLDTPGHEAFTAMRARGTRVTDIAVLVVAADDGVRPQTLEAISHARAAKVPMVVAVNKIDKEGANPDRVKQELSEHGLVPEEWGGDTIVVPVSALKGDNLDELLENILLVSEVEELSANPDRLAKGTVIEAHLDRARGPVASLLVQNGTLRVGDVLLAGSSLGKVRAMVDDRGNRVDEAGPSFAVEVLGLNDVPAAGDEFDVFESEREAKALASDRSDEQRQSRLQQAMASRRVSLTTLSGQIQEGELKELNLILKADVQGSVEAILGSLQQLPQNEVQVRVLLAAPGEVTETDVDLAAASNAVIVGFNTTLATGARRAADEAGVDVREYAVIYKLLDEIQAAMEGLLDPEEVEEPLGQAEVRAVFPVGRGAVAGCYVQSGKLVRDCLLRVHRGKELVHEGRLNSLKRMRDDVKEVNTGFECGIGVDSFSQWQEGDVLEAFKMVAKRRTLSA